MPLVTRIAHFSDVHFGKIAGDDIVTALIRDVQDFAPDVIVASGDLTQRAFRHQFNRAKVLLESFDVPVIAVPGNHDVYPWWRFAGRMFNPIGKWKTAIEQDLSPVWSNNDVTIAGVNSAWGRSIKNGRVTSQETSQISAVFCGPSTSASPRYCDPSPTRAKCQDSVDTMCAREVTN